MVILDFNQEPLKGMLLEAFHQQSRAFLQQQPPPDPQYTCEEVADLLGVDVSTVYTYLKLPAHHQRHLPVVRCTDSARGNRIRLSEVRAWQERNSQTLAEDKVEEPAKIMQISHRRAARRHKDAA